MILRGVIYRLGLLQRWFQEARLRIWEDMKDPDDESLCGRLSFQLWNVRKFSFCADAAIVGLMPPPLLELQLSEAALVLNSAPFIPGRSSCWYYCAVTIGEEAVISAYRLLVDRSRSLVGAILSKAVPAAFSTLASFSKMIWRSDQSSNKKSHVASQPFAKASPLMCLKDPPRKVERLTMSQSATLAVITDSLGRVLLLDTWALIVVRLWKGYREASCLFMEMLVSRDKVSSSSTYREHTRSDYCLCLAIHAPRKGIIEVWKVRTGPRLLAIQCPKGSRILQPSTRFHASTQSSYIPLEVFLLNGDSGQLSVLNRYIG